MAPNWQDDCRRLAGPRVVVVGVGNRDRGDDGAGCAVAEGLAEGGRVVAFDCGNAPENYLSRIAEAAPNDVVFVDAADVGDRPGAVRLLHGDHLQSQSLSTHAAGLATLADFLTRECGATCWLLAIQPGELGPSRHLSPAVQAAVDEIVASPVWADVGQAGARHASGS